MYVLDGFVVWPAAFLLSAHMPHLEFWGPPICGNFHIIHLGIANTITRAKLTV